MTTKELLLKEIEDIPESILNILLAFLRAIKAGKTSSDNSSMAILLERIDYLEAVIGIRKGLGQLEQGQGIPSAKAFADLEQRLQIPPRA